MLAEAGYLYSSSDLWGPDCTLPAPLKRPYRYREDGFPGFIEMPAFGWHENVLKGYSLGDKVNRLLPWPMTVPREAIPAVPITKPDEEFAINKIFIDWAVAEKMPYVSFVWHPWSLFKFDPQMLMLRKTMEYAFALGMRPISFHEQYRQLRDVEF
jgi:hypothetical protein